MDIQRFRSAAELALREGLVRRIDFSGATYQLEVYDPQLHESFWPFLQLDEQGEIRDAFCSCQAEDEGGCEHLVTAYLAIHDHQEQPLHVRFEHSFWNVLCFLSADHSGYEERFLKKENSRYYTFENEMKFSIEGNSSLSEQLLEDWFGTKRKETPENSIKFSNLTPEEIVRWREGRPTPVLRYALSFWSDIAKWAFFHQDQVEVGFEEDPDGFPTRISALFPDLHFKWEIKVADLEKLIPKISTLKTSLKLFRPVEEKVESMSYDEKNHMFIIKHVFEKERNKKIPSKQLGRWAYYSGIGFYEEDGKTLLSQAKVTEEEIPRFLSKYADFTRAFLPLAKKSVKVLYAMHFDTNWNWYFYPYLFKQGDLQEEKAALFDGWAYLPVKGFFPITGLLFREKVSLIPCSEVSRFVNHNRIFLNGQMGFQTHLAGIQSYLSYSLTEEGRLCFRTKTYSESLDSHDFGDWVYYSGQGFFLKKQTPLGLLLRPGLEVPSDEISRFIKKNRDELENIPHFFSSRLPLAECGLEIRAKSETSIEIKPIYKGEEGVRFFGDFVFYPDEGFSELPIQMRLPEEYQHEKIINQQHLSSFFIDELPRLRRYLIHLDMCLHPPLMQEFEARYLVRTKTGRLKGEFILHTEYGNVPVPKIAEAMEKRQRYLFSEGGLLDLHQSDFQWIRHLTYKPFPELKTIELTTLEFIRLDTTFSLLGPPDGEPAAKITQNLISELRDFRTPEPPNIRGLQSELRLYQQSGLKWLWFLYKNGLSALLCDDMGLGKTHQGMALIAATLNQKEDIHKRYLVVCPTSVIYHWEDKLATFLPKMKVHTFHGQKRSLKRLPKEGLILTTYGILRMEKKSIGAIPFEVAVFDEIQVAKNPASRVHQALKHIQAQMRIGLTGTPIENNLQELKALFDIILPGYMPSENRYREMFIHPIEREHDEEKKKLLSQMIRPFVLRRRKGEVLQELPEKSEDKSYCELSSEQRSLYKETLSKERDELVTKLRDRRSGVNFIHIFALLSILKQICNHPALVAKDPKNYKKYESGKWDLFIELLDEARESDQKVVVFSQYLYMLDIIENYLKEKGWGYAQIRGDTLDRRGELKRFQEDPDCVVFIGSLQAAGLGIDLTAASVVIMYDRWWNAARENQAIDRVHRLGQKWGVQVYKLITKETIEEKIDEMITKKGRLLEEIVSSDDQAVLKKFTRSELIELLSFYD